MKYKNILNIGLALVVGLIAAACSQNDDLLTDSQEVKMQNGFYEYPVDFNCSMPGYNDNDGTTRAVTNNWPKKATILARIKSGSTYYQGFIINEDTGWKLRTTNDFPNQTSGTCLLYFLQESNGDYYYLNSNYTYDIYNNGTLVKSTGLAWDTTPFELTPTSTTIFTDDAAQYSTTPGAFSMKGTLKPNTWRMRFSGTNGTTITLPGADNELLYNEKFEWSASSTTFNWISGKDVSLTVSGGYTPYIYGKFKNTGSNKITVNTGTAIYTRNFNASNLPTGSSGYFDIPTESNYSSKGWTKVAEVREMVLADFLKKPFGTVDVNLQTDSYAKILEKLQSLYKLQNDSSDPTHANNLSIFDSDNESLKHFTYYGMPFYHLFVSETYVSYTFEVLKTVLTDPYPTLDKIVKDFKNMGINMSYTKKNDSSTGIRAEGSITVGNINYGLKLTEYSSKWAVNITMYITSKSTTVANCKFVPNKFLAFTDACVTDWTAESKVAKGYYKIYKKSELSSKSDETIVSELKNQTERTVDYLNEYTNYTGNLTANTDYVLCTVAFDSNGQQGELYKYEFKTRATTLPKAGISNVTAKTVSGTNYWYMTMTAINSAKSYYCYSNESSTVNEWKQWYLWYRIYFAIQNNELGMGTSDSILDLWGDIREKRSASVYNVCTWAIVSGKTLGNPDSFQGSINSSAPRFNLIADGGESQIEDQVSSKEAHAAFKRGKLIRVNAY